MVCFYVNGKIIINYLNFVNLCCKIKVHINKLLYIIKHKNCIIADYDGSKILINLENNTNNKNVSSATNFIVQMALMNDLI